MPIFYMAFDSYIFDKIGFFTGDIHEDVKKPNWLSGFVKSQRFIRHQIGGWNVHMLTHGAALTESNICLEFRYSMVAKGR